jgi:hypothetical protein
MEGALVSILTAAAISLVFWWLARRFPAPQLSAEGPSLAELAPKYRRWEVISTFAYMVMWFPVSAIVFTPLHLVAQWRAQAMQADSATFVFFADGAALWIPAFFMALLLSAYALMPVLKVLLRGRYGEYERYVALKFGLDQSRVMRALSITIVMAFVVAVAALFDTYVVASSNELRLNPLLGLERRYSYTDIEQIVTAPALIAPNGNTVYRRVYLLNFKDATTFSSDSIPEHELLGRSDAELMQAILERSGTPVIEKPVFERGEL